MKIITASRGVEKTSKLLKMAYQEILETDRDVYFLVSSTYTAAYTKELIVNHLILMPELTRVKVRTFIDFIDLDIEIDPKRHALYIDRADFALRDFFEIDIIDAISVSKEED